MYVFLSILLQKYITNVNTLKLIQLGDFVTGILKNSIAKFLEYIAYVNSALYCNKINIIIIITVILM